MKASRSKTNCTLVYAHACPQDAITTLTLRVRLFLRAPNALSHALSLLFQLLPRVREFTLGLSLLLRPTVTDGMHLGQCERGRASIADGWRVRVHALE